MDCACLNRKEIYRRAFVPARLHIKLYANMDTVTMQTCWFSADTFDAGSLSLYQFAY